MVSKTSLDVRSYVNSQKSSGSNYYYIITPTPKHQCSLCSLWHQSKRHPDITVSFTLANDLTSLQNLSMARWTCVMLFLPWCVHHTHRHTCTRTHRLQSLFAKSQLKRETKIKQKKNLVGSQAHDCIWIPTSSHTLPLLNTLVCVGISFLFPQRKFIACQVWPKTIKHCIELSLSLF